MKLLSIFYQSRCSLVGACIGDAGVVPQEFDGANLTENAAKICGLSHLDNQYLGLMLQSPPMQRQIKQRILSAAQGKLALGRIAQLAIPICSESEQGKIVNKVHQAINMVKLLEERTRDVETLCQDLDQSILAKAFRGELVLQDPADEPASILLERIKAEREAQKPKKRTRKKRRDRGGKPCHTMPSSHSHRGESSGSKT